MILRNLEIFTEKYIFVSVSILLTTRYNYSHLLNGLQKRKIVNHTGMMYVKNCCLFANHLLRHTQKITETQPEWIRLET